MSAAAIFTILFVVSFAGSVMQAVVGFGYIILFMAIMPMFLPIGQCLVLAQLGGVLMSTWLLWGSFGKIDLRYILFPAVFASVGSLLGLLFLGSLSTDAYMKALGVLLVALALWMWLFSSRFKIRRSSLSGAVCGGAAGVLGALFSISVPPLVLYYSSNMEDKEGYMIALQATLEIQTAVCLIGRASFGMWPEGIWHLLPPLVLGLILGKFPGKHIYGRLDIEKLKKVIYLFVALLGLYTFVAN